VSEEESNNLKGKIVRFWHLLLFLMVSFSLQAQDARTGDIVLGQSSVFTGISSELGTDLWKGANAYFSYVNSTGGVRGRKIKVITKENNFDGKKNLANTIEFIKDDKVFALFNYLGTAALQDALPAVQKFSKEGFFLFSNYSGGVIQREKPHSDYVFNIRPSYWQETQGLVEQLYKVGKRRFGLFIQYDVYGRTGAMGVHNTLKGKNLEVVAQTSYQRGEPYTNSMRDQVKILLDAKVDAIIIVGSYAAAGAFIRDVRNAGYKGVIANVAGVGSDTLLGILNAEEKKTKKNYTSQLVNSEVVPLPTDISYKLVKEYQDIMKTYGVSHPSDLGDRPKSFSYTTLEGFLNAKVFVEILKKINGDITREAFIKTARELKNLDVGLGKDMVNFNNPASQGLNVIYYATIENGHYVNIKDWSKLP
jgi:branched-chain amino acid transport system substrate-binding protein